jgi:hypothetical protein
MLSICSSFVSAMLWLCMNLKTQFGDTSAQQQQILDAVKLRNIPPIVIHCEIEKLGLSER